MSEGHRQLLDILAQLACQAALGSAEAPYENMPDDLKSLLTVLRDLYTSCPGYRSFRIAPSCVRQLIFVAKQAPHIFPNPLARAMVRQIKPERLLDVLRNTKDLDLKGVDVEHIGWSGFLQSPHAPSQRTLTAVDRLIQPDLFVPLLDAYEDSYKSGAMWQPQPFSPVQIEDVAWYGTPNDVRNVFGTRMDSVVS
jgi:hypothetical protein